MPKTFLYSVNPVQMGLSAAAHVWRELKSTSPPPFVNLQSISYNEETWHSNTLAKEDPKCT